ncbi:hypothetical protein HT118_31075 [Escherichia coli]|nr:hypothetical protein [Escherichia coli]
MYAKHRGQQRLITLALLTSANLRQARIKSATGSLLSMPESSQANRGRSATDVKGGMAPMTRWLAELP